MNSDKLESILSRNPKWPAVLALAKEAKKSGGRVLVVGGAVRDAMMGDVESKDLDLELYGLTPAQARRVLKVLLSNRSLIKKLKSSQEKVKEIGKQFGVFSVFGIDIALPRTDSRTAPGQGRKPRVVSRPGLDFDQASLRRDLTINAMGYDPLSKELLDAHGGLKDLKAKILRAVDPDFFVDDPLRVLRVMQFAGRFGFRIDPKTLDLCRRTDLSHLAKERVGEEWQKLLFKSPKPSEGIKAGFKLRVIQRLHQVYSNGLRKNASALDVAAKLLGKMALDQSRRLLMLSALSKGVDPAKTATFFSQLNISKNETGDVLDIHKLFRLISSGTVSDYLTRSISFRLHVIPGMDFGRLAIFANILGNEQKVRVLASRAKVLGVFLSPPKPLVNGHDLITIGMKPGKEMGRVLETVFHKQLKGDFDVGHEPSKRRAISFVKDILDVDKAQKP